MQLRTYARILLNGWWLILSAVLASACVALIINFTQTPIYNSTATFVVSPGKSFKTVDEIVYGWNSINHREGVMQTYVEIATSRTILTAVYNELALTESQLKNINVTSEMIPSTNIIKITVESNDPRIAKACADLVARKTLEYISDLSTIYDMKPLDLAYVPRIPAKPDKTRNLLVATLLGSLVGIGSAFLLHNLRSPRGVITGINILDSETGVSNRGYLLQRLGEELSRARRNSHPLSLAVLNIEHLDMINDMRLLPRTRIEALRRVGLFLKQNLHQEDLVARLEGDRFALLLPDTSGPDAELILKKLQASVESTVFDLEEGNLKLNLTATAGVVALNGNDINSDELLVRAERILQRGRNSRPGKVYLSKDGRASETD